MRYYNRGSGFSIFFFIAVIVFVWWYPFEETEELRDESFQNTETLSTEKVSLEGSVMKDGHTMAPAVRLLEEMDAVIIENDAEAVTAEKGDITIELTEGSGSASLNGEEAELELPANREGNTLYAPARFIAESLGGEVSWEDAEHAMLIEYDNKEILAPVEQPLEEEQSQAQGNADMFQAAGISVGDDVNLLEQMWGEPERITESHYGFEWYAYHDNYKNFRMAGVADGEVTALYTNTSEVRSPEGLSQNLSRQEVRDKMGDPETAIVKGNTRYSLSETEESDLFPIEEGYLTVYYDIHQDNKATAYQLIGEDAEQSLSGYYAEGSAQLAEDFSRQMFDLVNADRVEFDLDPLDWNDEIAAVSIDHSEDMAEQQYFSHENLEGASPFDRIREAGISYTRAGENIASGQPSAVMAQRGLMNSPGHRENILNQYYRELGVGTAFDMENRPFYTQKFYTR
ncbi:CAP-associated domain-containing protein [Alkalicoccus halolimnae]|uniref:CAP-associated domain-containing protein n=1 Tax=Alkalicoccus halolimnae TaxID=1667239 RepID=A0AAJ8LTV6_9BACI|nr:CAP-associated domain-containing protein [Alkalicoccus halolimnae]